MKKHIKFLHVWKAIDHTVLLALSYFRHFLLSTDEYLPHTVLDCIVIDLQATTFLYLTHSVVEPLPFMFKDSKWFDGYSKQSVCSTNQTKKTCNNLYCLVFKHLTKLLQFIYNDWQNTLHIHWRINCSIFQICFCDLKWWTHHELPSSTKPFI